MKGQRVGIFFFLPGLGGGSTTFTAHLYEAFKAAGAHPFIYKVRKRDESSSRPFGKYEGISYLNISYESAKRLAKEHPSVMAAPAHSKYLVRPDLISRLMRRGMRIVIHDPNEFKVYDHLKEKLPQRPICIRPSMQKFYPEALWIPHPYRRSKENFGFPPRSERQSAVSVARIASVKRPTILLEANRLLPKQDRIQLLGAEHRLYTRGLEQRYGDVFKQSGKTLQFPLTFAAPVEVCADYNFHIDMTWFPDDGGGTQYAQMEAMDAGTVNIMHEDWFRIKGELTQKHVLTVKGPKKLAKIIRNGYSKDEHFPIIDAGWELLRKHEPKVIGEMYMKELLA